ncbi:MAG: S-layer protein, partial [Candidatus Micrarchaeia archaeon]
MKSIDVKKVAAITAGVALLGASLLAAAPVTIDNIDVISAQGQPTVQIVVGKNAAASDGVAAANIAAVIGSLSYASKKVSAKL